MDIETNKLKIMNIYSPKLPNDETPAGLNIHQLQLRAFLLSLPDVEMIEVEHNVFEVVEGQSDLKIKY